MKRILDSFNRRGSGTGQDSQGQSVPQGDSPESTVVREVGDEFLHLPAIVEAAESSPVAARDGANCIRKFLAKDYSSRAYAQYNAVMLMRILTDNPGRTFTRNFDATFVRTVKELLREGRDLSVQQILRETLDSFATAKADDDTLGLLMDMWKKEKIKNNTKVYGNSAGPHMSNGAPPVSQQGNHFARQHRQPRSLPPPDELAARIEEAKTTAKLLSQTVQSTPNAAIPAHDLVKEFADRASSASRSIQAYIHSTNPAPDEDTLLTLIETNEELSVAMSKHQRALLQARRTMSSSPPRTAPPQNDQQNYAPPQGPPPGAMDPAKKQGHAHPPPRSPPPRAQDHVYTAPPHPPPKPAPPEQQQREQREQTNNYEVPENPFADDAYQQTPPRQPHGLFSRQNQAALPSGLHQHPSQPEPLQSRTSNQMPSYQPPLNYPNRQNSASNTDR